MLIGILSLNSVSMLCGVHPGTRTQSRIAAYKSSISECCCQSQSTQSYKGLILINVFKSSDSSAFSPITWNEETLCQLVVLAAFSDEKEKERSLCVPQAVEIHIKSAIQMCVCVFEF